MAYVPLITSFLLVWIETWFLDFKVLPQEQTFREVWGKREQLFLFSVDTQLVRGKLQAKVRCANFSTDC